MSTVTSQTQLPGCTKWVIAHFQLAERILQSTLYLLNITAFTFNVPRTATQSSGHNLRQKNQKYYESTQIPNPLFRSRLAAGSRLMGHVTG